MGQPGIPEQEFELLGRLSETSAVPRPTNRRLQEDLGLSRRPSTAVSLNLCSLPNLNLSRPSFIGYQA